MDGNYFTGFITSIWSPILWFLIFLGATLFVVYKGVDAGIERMSKILMPVLLVLILCISCFSLTLSHTDDSGCHPHRPAGPARVRSAQFCGMTLRKFLVILTDAMGQLFYSISVAMGIMITYGSYVKKETNLVKSVNQIEIFDTVVAFLAGMMIIPAVFIFSGTEGMSAGPTLMFQSLPKVFGAMGSIGVVVGIVFFVTVAFAALTSSVSIMEAIVSSAMDKFHISRQKACIGRYAHYAGHGSGCLPGLQPALLRRPAQYACRQERSDSDILDYISNYVMMPVLSIGTCILVGWMIKPKAIIDEVTLGGYRFRREKLYVVMVKFVIPPAPVLPAAASPWHHPILTTPADNQPRQHGCSSATLPRFFSALSVGKKETKKG